MGWKLELLCIFLAAMATETMLFSVAAEPVEDKQALLDFLHNIGHAHSLNWNESSSVCTSWRGVTCNNDQSRVIALRLPGAGLTGPIPIHTLSRLTEIQTLSLRSNGITDFSVWKNLITLTTRFRVKFLISIFRACKS
ncbi:hypothetical protein L6164_016297 [Bauhinia variegata]|uniref:Uncharacterized protein n=1 Tax=Bauhinia variegata TaxID=167791 RepID=A0ACB9NP46_BAUVA|nr:hypothetical protein L6164_016297 [Bauhinia variegata]